MVPILSDIHFKEKLKQTHHNQMSSGFPSASQLPSFHVLFPLIVPT